MTRPDPRPAVAAFLRRAGLLAAGDPDPVLTPLTGGVSSDLWRADLPSGPVCAMPGTR